jgi:hypothetical protein
MGRADVHGPKVAGQTVYQTKQFKDSVRILDLGELFEDVELVAVSVIQLVSFLICAS